MTIKPIKAREADHHEFKTMAVKAGKTMLDFVRVLLDSYKKHEPAAKLRKTK